MTRTFTRLSPPEMQRALAAFASSSIDSPSQPSRSQIRLRISAWFSPIPAVKTIPSKPQSDAASAPNSARKRGVEGKRGAGRVEYGGGRYVTKKKTVKYEQK